ncbi:acylphosphatase [Pseudoalteromonas sp. G4]|uniref:acylphosphatase n=1 Tax=Pseudoalteromonas sp. G4 TaxID=2992761 RepID=UPI00237E0435|nr:acylphosphatase [Pseudoalteromonas sp. G4]MDE3272723.1 acylphosphatase [Pseudoalteromonas sp. G4]
MSERTLKAIVAGRVQGVFYRASVKQVAEQLGISGYAKNLANGEVEVEATGQDLKLIKFTEFLEQGPSQADVEKVSWDYIQTKQFDGFEVQ